MKGITLVLILILTTTTQARRRPVCAIRTNIPHEGVPVPFAEPANITIPLRIHVLCSARRGMRRASLPLLILMPGALARAFDYKRLANVLARSGFVVAIPSYSSRKLFEPLSPILDTVAAFVQSNRDMGFACNANGQFVTVKLITSVLNFFLADDSPHAEVRASANMRRTIIFGHTFGGAVSELFFNDVCAPVTEPVIPPPESLATDPQTLPRVTCEQFTPFSSSRVRVRGLVTYEGFTNTSVIEPVKTGTFYVAIHSSFYTDNIANFFGGKSFNRKVATVRISNANHYAPTNFVTENENQRPVCARVRPPPEDMFTTTREVQNTVIKSIATAIKGAFDVYVQGKSRKVLTRLTRTKKLLVEKVHFL